MSCQCTALPDIAKRTVKKGRLCCKFLVMRSMITCLKRYTKSFFLLWKAACSSRPIRSRFNLIHANDFLGIIPLVLLHSLVYDQKLFASNASLINTVRLPASYRFSSPSIPLSIRLRLKRHSSLFVANHLATSFEFSSFIHHSLHLAIFRLLHRPHLYFSTHFVNFGPIWRHFLLHFSLVFVLITLETDVRSIGSIKP